MKLHFAFSARSFATITMLVGLLNFAGCQGQPPAVANGKVQDRGEATQPGTAPSPLEHPLSGLSASINVAETKVVDATAADEEFASVSLEELQAQGEEGDPESLAELGRRFDTGTGTPVDYKKAAEWYHRAAEKQDVNAMVRLGMMYQQGRGVRLDARQSALWFRLASNKNQPLAMARLGQLYLEGIGVDRDLETAATWLRKAAEQGEPDAMLEIAGLLESGMVSEQDFDEAGRWRSKARECMESAATTDNLRAMRWLAEWAVANDPGQPGFEEAQSWLLRASELGDTMAMVLFAELLAEGAADPQQQSEAIAWCIKAAEMMEPSALLLLADFHERGYGVPRNVRQAFELRRQSAERGDIRGMRLCGEMLLQGRGTKVQLNEGLRWYQLAAGLGDGPSLAHIGICFKEGQGYEKNDAMAVAYFTRGAALNDSESHFQLAVCRETGVSVPQDLMAAAQSFQRSAGLGHREAMFRLAELFCRDDTGLQAFAADAVSWYELAALKGHAGAAERLAQMYARGDGVEQSEQLAATWKVRADAALNRVEDASGVPASGETENPWGMLTAAKGAASVTVEGDQLLLKLNVVPGQSNSGPASAPRIMRDVTGDFTAVVTLPGPWRWAGSAADAGATTPPPGIASLLIWQDEENYARLERVGTLQDDQIRYACEFLIVQEGVQLFQAAKALPHAEVRLRLERNGNRLRASMTHNGGQSWATFRSQLIDLPAAAKIGIAAFHNSAKPLTAEFQEFVLVSKE